MKKIIIIIASLFLFACNKEDNNTRFYLSSLEDRIAKIDKNALIVYNVKDSLEIVLGIRNKELTKDGKPLGIQFKILKDSLLIFDNNKTLFNKKVNKFKGFSNEVDLAHSNAYWKLNESSFDSIYVYLNNGKFTTYNGYEIIEEGDYIVSNDFNNYNLFISNSTKTFSDTYYLITVLDSTNLVLVDMNSSREISFNKYHSKIDSLLFGNWSIVNVLTDSIKFINENGYSCVRSD